MKRHSSTTETCSNSKEGQGSHYVYISDSEKMIRGQLTKSKNSIVLCKKCFTFFKSTPTSRLGLTGEQKLIDHQRYCLSKEPLRLDPSPETSIHFKNSERSQPVRFVIYADFVCALEPTTNSSESITHDHVSYSYCFLVKDSLNDTQVIRRYRGPWSIFCILLKNGGVKYKGYSVPR